MDQLLFHYNSWFIETLHSFSGFWRGCDDLLGLFSLTFLVQLHLDFHIFKRCISHQNFKYSSQQCGAYGNVKKKQNRDLFTAPSPARSSSREVSQVGSCRKFRVNLTTFIQNWEWEMRATHYLVCKESMSHLPLSHSFSCTQSNTRFFKKCNQRDEGTEWQQNFVSIPWIRWLKTDPSDFSKSMNMSLLFRAVGVIS